MAEVVSVNAEEETVTFSKTLNPYTDFNDYSAKFYAYVDKASFSLEAGTHSIIPYRARNVWQAGTNPEIAWLLEPVACPSRTIQLHSVGRL